MSVNTVWMWQDGEYTRGVNLEYENGVLVWQDDLVGFGCVTIPDGQPISDFMENGPGRYAAPPADIEQEIRATIRTLQAERGEPGATKPDDSSEVW